MQIHAPHEQSLLFSHYRIPYNCVLYLTIHVNKPWIRIPLLTKRTNIIISISIKVVRVLYLLPSDIFSARTLSLVFHTILITRHPSKLHTVDTYGLSGDHGLTMRSAYAILLDKHKHGSVDLAEATLKRRCLWRDGTHFQHMHCPFRFVQLGIKTHLHMSSTIRSNQFQTMFGAV